MRRAILSIGLATLLGATAAAQNYRGDMNAANAYYNIDVTVQDNTRTLTLWRIEKSDLKLQRITAMDQDLDGYEYTTVLHEGDYCSIGETPEGREAYKNCSKGVAKKAKKLIEAAMQLYEKDNAR